MTRTPDSRSASHVDEWAGFVGCEVDGETLRAVNDPEEERRD